MQQAQKKTDTEYRIVPHNAEAEQGLLGALLVNNIALEKVGDFLRAEHFYIPAHQRIYTAIEKLIDRGQMASPVTLKNYFETDSDLETIGGADYLAQLAANVVSVMNAADYGRTIYDLYLRRALVDVGEEMVQDAMELTIDRDAIAAMEAAESRLFKLAEHGDTRGKAKTLKEAVMGAIEIAQRAYKTQGHVTGTTTGLRDLDEKLGGLHDSDLLILAGRPGMGKTALATNIAFAAAQRYADSGGDEGAVVGFFSLEMSADQLATRILADQAKVSGDSIRKGAVRETDFQRFVEASQRLAQIPLYIDDTPALSISALRTRARRLKRQHNMGLLVVDYLQLMQGSGSRQSSDSRVQEISEITRGLKAIAKELHIPVIALSQLSRQVEQREDKRPQLSDLRESGSIEQDADAVMFVFREEYYLQNTQPDMEDHEKHASWQEKMDRAHNKAEIILAKQRHGPVGTVRVFFDHNFTRFADLDDRYTE